MDISKITKPDRELTNENRIVQSSHPKPDLILIRDQNRMPTKMGVRTKKTMAGTWTMSALLSPGRFPSTMAKGVADRNTHTHTDVWLV